MPRKYTLSIIVLMPLLIKGMETTLTSEYAPSKRPMTTFGLLVALHALDRFELPVDTSDLTEPKESILYQEAAVHPKVIELVKGNDSHRAIIGSLNSGTWRQVENNKAILRNNSLTHNGEGWSIQIKGVDIANNPDDISRLHSFTGLLDKANYLNNKIKEAQDCNTTIISLTAEDFMHLTVSEHTAPTSDTKNPTCILKRPPSRSTFARKAFVLSCTASIGVGIGWLMGKWSRK